MREYNINHIISSSHYLQSNGLAGKYVQIVRNLFYKATEEGKDLFNHLMVYCSTPLSSTLHSSMQILTSRAARLSLPMSNAARKQQGLDCEDLRTKYKNEHLPPHDLHLNQAVMYQEPSTKQIASSNYHLVVSRTKKLHHNNKRRCPIQKVSSPLEVIPSSRQNK